MPRAFDVETILIEACKLERGYDWLKAARSYEEALDSRNQAVFRRMGEVRERLGYAYFRAAMQAKGVCEFRDRMRQAALSYETAKDAYGNLGDKATAPRVLRCDAMIAYIGYWLGTTVPEKKRLIEKCWRLTKRALEAFDKCGDNCEFGKTFNQLSLSVLLGFFLEWNYEIRRRVLREVADYGEQAIEGFSTFEDSHELAAAYVRTAAFLEMFGFYFLDLDEREGWIQRASSYWLKAKRLSGETAVIELLNCAAGVALPLEGSEWEWSKDKILIDSGQALECSKKTRDRFTAGLAFAWLAFRECVKLEAVDSQVEGREANERGLKYAKEAQRNFSAISFTNPLWGGFWTESPLAEYYLGVADCETNLKRKRDLLQRGRKAALDQLKRAEETGYPEAICYARMMSSSILRLLASTEMDPKEKRSLLEEALVHENESIRILERFLPFFYWIRGVARSILATAAAELAELSKDLETKRRLLQEAALNQGDAVTLVVKQVGFWEKKGAAGPLWARLATLQYRYGRMLSLLYDCTGNEEHLRKAVEALREAAEVLQRFNATSQMAECHWRNAQTHDTLGEYLTAAEHFGLASRAYKRAAQRISQFKSFYRDLAFYMEAWSEVERAKHHHRRQEYNLAGQHFESAADMFKSSKQWRYLAPNYSAWAQVEHAEKLSRSEQSEEAVEGFEQAASLFEETKESLRVNLDKVESEQEKQMATGLVEATGARREYCLARISIEEARILDQKGEHYSSSERYDSAAETFKKIAHSLTSKDDIREFQILATISRAWQKMTLAEANVSPELFDEASKVFEQASHLCSSETTRFSTLGHSHFCKALGAGIRFTDTREIAAYSTAMQHLQSATQYYKRASLENEAQYARATGLLFDSYVYMDNAKKEMDPDKKARLYKMAEMLLQASAGCYMKAKRPEKREQVLRLLEGVKEDRELALSLTEVLHIPPVSTTTFAAPTPTYEKSVGLERLEHAVVQVHLQASPEVTVGEEFEVRLDLVNVAKSLGLLVRIDDLIPQGFKAIELPAQYKLDDGSLNMNGKRLEPLKVETIKISMKASEAGVFGIAPKVVYTDDAGGFEACKPETLYVTVQPPLTYEFKSPAAGKAFDYLIQAFVEDYMKRGIFIQEAGWRSLVQIIKNTGISLRSVYGDRGRHGFAVAELEKRGLIEIRIFPGRRGRGGEVQKVRISYEKEIMKRYVDAKVARVGKNQERSVKL